MITKTIATIRTLKHHLTNWLDAAPQSTALISSAQALENDRQQIRKIEQDIRNLYIVGARKQAAQQKSEWLRRKLESSYDLLLATVQQNLEAICDRYAMLHEAWTGEPLAAGRQPVPQDEDIALGRGCRLAGMMAMALDIHIVTSLMKEYYGLFWALLGALVPMLILAILLDKVILAVTRREALRKSLQLIGYVFWPSLVLSLLMLLIILPERYMSGLSPMFTALFDGAASLATLIVTPSLLFLGSSLLAMGSVYSWSLPLSRNFDQFLQQYAEVISERREFVAGQRPPTDKDGEPKSPARRFFPPSLVLACVLAYSGFLAGCGESQGHVLETSKANEAVAAAPPSDRILNIEIDRSGSVEAQAGQVAAQTLQQQLVEVIARMRATALRLRIFKADGWSAPVILMVALPRYQEPIIPNPHFKDWPNRKADWERLKAELEKQAQQEYRTKLTEALARAKVTAELLNPATDKPSICTDGYGVLSRISKGQYGTREEVYLIVSDGYDTCSKGAMRVLKPPQGKVQVLVLVTAALAKESGKRRPQQQFESREKWLKKIAPWAQAVAAFETNLAEILWPVKDVQLTADATREPQR